MDATFETIGLEVPSEKAINFLAERAENQGEPTHILRRGAVLHGPTGVEPLGFGVDLEAREVRVEQAHSEQRRVPDQLEELPRFGPASDHRHQV